MYEKQFMIVAIGCRNGKNNANLANHKDALDDMVDVNNRDFVDFTVCHNSADFTI